MESKQVHKSLQVLLWLWFGLISSFVSVSVVNIAKLETETKAMRKQIDDLHKSILFPNHQNIKNK